MRRLITQLGVYTAYPGAYVVLGAFALLWAVFSPDTLGWHGAAALATLFMTLLIKRAERRDTLALHAKLDGILHALGDARSELSSVDEKEPEEIERERKQIQRRG